MTSRTVAIRSRRSSSTTSSGDRTSRSRGTPGVSGISSHGRSRGSHGDGSPTMARLTHGSVANTRCRSVSMNDHSSSTDSCSSSGSRRRARSTVSIQSHLDQLRGERAPGGECILEADGSFAMSTPIIDAAGLAQADGAPASQVATYTAVYDELGTHCSNPRNIAFTLSTAVSVLNGEGAKTSNLRFMQGLIRAVGWNVSARFVAYQTRVSESASGQPTPLTPLPVTHAPAGPSLPPSGCTGLTWPQPIPRDLIGASAKEAMTDALLCFTVAAIAPDGHDIMTDPANDLTPWVITSVRPASGTPVGEHDVITIHVCPQSRRLGRRRGLSRTRPTASRCCFQKGTNGPSGKSSRCPGPGAHRPRHQVDICDARSVPVMGKQHPRSYLERGGCVGCASKSVYAERVSPSSLDSRMARLDRSRRPNAVNPAASASPRGRTRSGWLRR